jgi:hypothetical protein
MKKYYVFKSLDLNSLYMTPGSMEDLACEIAAFVSQGAEAKQNLISYSEDNSQATWEVLKKTPCFTLEIDNVKAEIWKKEARQLVGLARNIDIAIGNAYSEIVNSVRDFDNACEHSENFQDVRVFDDLGLDAAFEILENNSEYSVLNIVEEIFKVTAF